MHAGEASQLATEDPPSVGEARLSNRQTRRHRTTKQPRITRFSHRARNQGAYDDLIIAPTVRPTLY